MKKRARSATNPNFQCVSWSCQLKLSPDMLTVVAWIFPGGTSRTKYPIVDGWVVFFDLRLSGLVQWHDLDLSEYGTTQGLNLQRREGIGTRSPHVDDSHRHLLVCCMGDKAIARPYLGIEKDNTWISKTSFIAIRSFTFLRKWKL